MKPTTPTTDSAPNTPKDISVACDRIDPDPKNRDRISSERIASLAVSIAAEGLLQPIILRPLPEGRFRIIAGEHRWRAHLHLKLPTIAARVFEDADDLGAARKKAVENFQREALTPIEEARRFLELQDLGMTQAEVGKLLGRSQPVVANALRLLELPTAVQALLSDGTLSAAHGVALARFTEYPKVCEAIATQAAKEHVPSKALSKGLPFAYELARAGVVADLQVYNRSELPKEHQAASGIITSKEDMYSGGVYHLDPAAAKPVLAAIEARRAKDQASSQRHDGRTADGKMTDTAKAERKRKIASNKRNRADTAAQLAQALDTLKHAKDLNKAALAVVVDQALRHDQNASSLKQVIVDVGIIPPARLITSSWHTEVSLAKLQTMTAAQMVHLAAAAILKNKAEQAIRFAGECPGLIKAVTGSPKAKGKK